MLLVRSRSEVGLWSEHTRKAGRRIGLVPTMGSLHAGHTSLIDVARRSVDRIALSIFVNPLQFGPAEDYESYPRDLERDLDVAAAAGVDLVFAPPDVEMYPNGEPGVNVVPVGGVDRLCGRSRPGHFTGVLTVVAKLFGIVTPDVAVFGQKDYQQLVLIRRMATDLNFPVDVESGPIVREADGLAMSSRNRHLSATDRKRALRLSATLRSCAQLFAGGHRDPQDFVRELHRAGGAGVSVEYGEVVHPESLAPVDRVEEGAVCAVAAFVGDTRLIDNHVLGTDPGF
ncbi:MAG: pantoate--beta-alanine ligase [Gemmatimonas sp.]|nr:pantoate--beta-alanine ligase [Gemmatimonas sp.]